MNPIYRDYVGVLLSNEVWREQLATVPFDRRLLLLPKCLRVEDKCPAPFDEFGLLCKQCGLCTIQDLQEEAERLGYAVLVAEGSALVMALIQTGKIDAIVGVSCLSVLERAFPYMEAAAIPGVAIPLLQDDCKDTTVDIDWVWDVVHLTSDDRTRRLDLDALRSEVETMVHARGARRGARARRRRRRRVARAWLGRGGQAVAAVPDRLRVQGAAGRPGGAVAATRCRMAAVAVECFHKASLVHDDIEDADDATLRRPTLHVEHGVPVALNAGDLLVGEGYRLLAGCGAPGQVSRRARPDRRRGTSRAVPRAGRGARVDAAPAPLTADQVIDIFRRKTAPAFRGRPRNRRGARRARRPRRSRCCATTARRSASPIRFATISRTSRTPCRSRRRLRRAVAAACAGLRQGAGVGPRSRLGALAQRRGRARPTRAAFRALLERARRGSRARALLEAYKEQAIRTLPALQNASLKGLLRRVVGKVFRVEIKGWCSEFEARDAAGRQAGAQAAG